MESVLMQKERGFSKEEFCKLYKEKYEALGKLDYLEFHKDDEKPFFNPEKYLSLGREVIFLFVPEKLDGMMNLIMTKFIVKDNFVYWEG